ncbi:MAG: hypothetical protein WBA53_09555 [Burkholderiaceae bacterium]
MTRDQQRQEQDGHRNTDGPRIDHPSDQPAAGTATPDRSIPVVDQDRNLVGIVALGDLAVEDEENVDEALRDISMPA